MGWGATAAWAWCWFMNGKGDDRNIAPDGPSADRTRKEVAAILLALDSLDPNNPSEVREMAKTIRWALERRLQQDVRMKDIAKNALAVIFGILATVVAGLLLKVLAK